MRRNTPVGWGGVDRPTGGMCRVTTVALYQNSGVTALSGESMYQKWQDMDADNPSVKPQTIGYNNTRPVKRLAVSLNKLPVSGVQIWNQKQ